jgi:hypothetical protein
VGFRDGRLCLGVTDVPQAVLRRMKCVGGIRRGDLGCRAEAVE